MDTLSADRLYWAKDVAELLFARHIDWFYQHRAKLEAEEGFPRPISCIGRPRWAGRALIAWRDRPCPVQDFKGAAPALGIDYTQLVRQRLEARRLGTRGA